MIVNDSKLLVKSIDFLHDKEALVSKNEIFIDGDNIYISDTEDAKIYEVEKCNKFPNANNPSSIPLSSVPINSYKAIELKDIDYTTSGIYLRGMLAGKDDKKHLFEYMQINNTTPQISENNTSNNYSLSYNRENYALIGNLNNLQQCKWKNMSFLEGSSVNIIKEQTQTGDFIKISIIEDYFNLENKENEVIPNFLPNITTPGAGNAFTCFIPGYVTCGSKQAQNRINISAICTYSAKDEIIEGVSVTKVNNHKHTFIVYIPKDDFPKLYEETTLAANNIFDFLKDVLGENVYYIPKLIGEDETYYNINIQTHCDKDILYLDESDETCFSQILSTPVVIYYKL